MSKPLRAVPKPVVPEEVTDTATATEPAEEEDSSYMEIPLETLPINVTIPCTVYIKHHEKLLVFRRQGEKLNYKTAFELQKKGVETVFIHKAFWELFVSSLDDFDPKLDKRKVTPGGHMQHLLLTYGQELEKRLKEPKGPMFVKLKQTASSISHSIIEDDSKSKELVRKSEDGSLYFVHHSVNSAVYAAVIARRLGLTKAEIEDVTYATLVHDVGYLSLPKKILFKFSALTNDEELAFKSHPKLGAELLYSVNTPGPILRAVLQHHEFLDGTGYPAKLKEEEINIFAKIIAVADMFDDLTSNRPQENAISKHDALTKMQAMGAKIDLGLVELLPLD